MARVTEFEVRPIDADGDAVDVDRFDTMPEAIRFAERIAPDYPAVVVERHRMIVEDDGRMETVDTEVVWHAGSEEALIAWGG